MNINFYSDKYCFRRNLNQDKNVNNIVFSSNTPQKLIQKIMMSQDLKSIKLTFSELSKIYLYLGYDITYKRGSHAIVHIDENFNMPLLIPHKDKYMHKNDIERLKLVINGDIENLKKSI